MSDEPPPLPPEARALLDASRSAERVPDAKRAEVYARVLRTVAAPGPGGGSSPQGPPAGASASLSVTSGPAIGVVFAVAATVAVALWSGARGHTTRDSPPAPVRVQRVEPAAPAPPPPPLPAAADASLAVTDASIATAPDAPLPHTHSPDLEDDLGAEVALIDEARAALARGDAREVHRVVRQHRHLRHHRLDAEMDVLEVRAFVLAHDVTGAERAAERFHRRHPQSVLAAQVDDAARSVR